MQHMIADVDQHPLQSLHNTRNGRLNVHGQYMITHRFKDKFNVICIGGTGEVRVDVFRTLRDHIKEHPSNKLPSRLIVTLWS